MLGTAGHVDHGKTALIKMLTGCNTDRLAEEQRRGLTIEPGFAPCRLYDERIVGVVDVPGHVDFIRNMVAGAHGIDAVIFVIAANDGVMPQTREHLDILTLMGVHHGLIALTKIDMVDDEMQELARDEVRDFVRGTFLDGAPVCPISNITGEGFDGFFTALNTQVNACDDRPAGGVFRMWVSEVFSIRGFGTVVTGVPSSGAVHVGDQLHLLPNGRTGRVRRLEVYGEEAAEGRAGECVAFNLTDVPAELLHRGQVLCASDALHPATMAEAEVRLLDFVTHPLKDYAEVHLHVGSAETMAHVAVLDEKALQPGRSHFVQLRLQDPLGIAPGDRFVIRAGVAGVAGGRLTTIGGGRILGVSNLKLRRNRAWTLEGLTARRDALDDPAAWASLHLQEKAVPLTAAELARRALLAPSQAAALLSELTNQGTIIESGQGFVHRNVVQQAGNRVQEALDAFYAGHPLAAGLEEPVLLGALKLNRTVFSLALQLLLDDGIIKRQGAIIALCGRAVNLSSEEEALRVRLETLYRNAGLCPPESIELPGQLGAPAARIAGLLELLTGQGHLIRISPELFFSREAVEQASATALRLFAQAGAFTTMDFRDALGVSRKYAVPLLDYFDTQRLTVRQGNRRTPGVAAR